MVFIVNVLITNRKRNDEVIPEMDCLKRLGKLEVGVSDLVGKTVLIVLARSTLFIVRDYVKKVRVYSGRDDGMEEVVAVVGHFSNNLSGQIFCNGTELDELFYRLVRSEKLGVFTYIEAKVVSLLSIVDSLRLIGLKDFNVLEIDDFTLGVPDFCLGNEPRSLIGIVF